MVLATTVLLLQFLAIPNTALPVTDEPAAAAEKASVSTDISITNASPKNSDELLSKPKLSSNVTYAPGRLIAEPILTSSPAESSSVGPGSGSVIMTSESSEDRLRWEQCQKKIWLGLSILQSSAATFDAWSTRRVIASGRGQERNPLLRPFAGNSSLYAAIQVSPLVLDYVGRRMLTSRHGWMRRTWWIPQALGTGVSLASGVSNLRVP